MLRDASLFVKEQKESVVHSNEPLPILLRYREAARELGVSERQIHNLVEKNLLEKESKARLEDHARITTTTSVLKLAAQRESETPTAA